MRAVDAATAKCGCDGEDDVMPENISELPSAITGYSLLHLSQPIILTFSSIKILQLHIDNWELAGPVTFDLLPHYQV
ncbi:uncharacterized protein DS421_20g689960 [Arachis hypogaea]|nr:uncharacterized protein DS421_20g689960 [Arachis hypogaea]